LAESGGHGNFVAAAVKARGGEASWRRAADYYDESTLIWLEADTILRRESKGQKSLDDFCKRFHGTENGVVRVVPYTLDDVVAAMNAVGPYDWKKFFGERIHSHGPGAPLGGLENSGWKLVFTEVMNDHQRSKEETDHVTDLSFSLGFFGARPRRRRGEQCGGCHSRFASVKSRTGPGDETGGGERTAMDAGRFARSN